MGDLSDRREARRFAMNLPVRVLVNDANRPELKANTRDVSYRGLYFVVEAPFEKGSEIDFILTLPQQIISAGDVNIRCHGHVVRVEKKGFLPYSRVVEAVMGQALPITATLSPVPPRVSWLDSALRTKMRSR